MLTVAKLKQLEDLKYSDFYWLIISTLQNRGGSAKKKVVIDEIIANNNFSEEVLNAKTTDGRIGKIDNMISWSRNDLRVGGYLKSDSPRGLWELTEKGVAVTESELLSKPMVVKTTESFTPLLIPMKFRGE